MTVGEKKDTRVALVHNPKTRHSEVSLDHLALTFIKKEPKMSLEALAKAIRDIAKTNNIDDHLKPFVSLDSSEISAVDSTRPSVQTALSLQAGQSALLVNGRASFFVK